MAIAERAITGQTGDVERSIIQGAKSYSNMTKIDTLANGLKDQIRSILQESMNGELNGDLIQEVASRCKSLLGLLPESLDPVRKWILELESCQQYLKEQKTK